MNHDNPFGGKLETCFAPSFTRRTNFIVASPAHSPFHACRFLSVSSSAKSGTQKPVLNSLSSVSVRCDSASSRLAGGRPFRRSLRNCSISGTLLSMYLFGDRVSRCSSLTNEKGIVLNLHTVAPILLNRYRSEDL